MIVHKAKHTAVTSARTTHTRQNNPYRLGVAPAGVAGARGRCCPAATVPAAVVIARVVCCIAQKSKATTTATTTSSSDGAWRRSRRARSYLHSRRANRGSPTVTAMYIPYIHMVQGSPSGRHSEHAEPSRSMQTHIDVKKMSAGLRMSFRNCMTARTDCLPTSCSCSSARARARVLVLECSLFGVLERRSTRTCILEHIFNHTLDNSYFNRLLCLQLILETIH